MVLSMTLIVFFFVFDFSLIKSFPMITSSMLVLVLLLLYCFFSPKYNKILSIELGSRYNQFIVKSLLFLIAFSVAVTVFQKKFDFSYAKTLIHQLLIMEIGVFVLALFRYKNEDIEITVIKAFFVQSIIQTLSFLSPTFLRITDYFRPESTIAARNLDYSGYRGLAVSSSNFFGLAAAYAVLFVMISFNWERWRISITRKTIVLLFLVFGAMSSGRSAIVGILVFAISILYRFTKARKSLHSVLDFLRFLLIALLALPWLFIFLSDFFAGNKIWHNFLNYVLQVFGGSLSISNFDVANSSSLSELIYDFYFPISWKQFFIGDGLYTNADGSYYMHTDAGYMRNILFGGIFLIISLFIYQIRLLGMNAYQKTSKLYVAVIVAVLAILEYKGQVVGFLLTTQSMLILLSYSFLMREIDMSNVNRVAYGRTDKRNYEYL